MSGARPPLWRRVVRIASRVLAGLIVLIVAAIGFLHTSWGKSVVRGVVEKRLAAKVNGSVTIGSLDYGFLFRRISLGEIEIRDVRDDPAIRIASIDLQLERGALLRNEIILDDLAIAGVDVASPNVNGLFKTSTSRPLAHVQVKRLAISGQATITRPDGMVIAIRDLALAGSVDAHPAAKAVDLAIGKLAAQVDVAGRHIAVAVDDAGVKQRGAVLDIGIAKLAAGAVSLEAVEAHIDRSAQHRLDIGKARLDHAQLATLLGRDVLVDDVGLELSISGPESALVLAGTVRTRDTSLAITGTADVSTPTPRYQLALVGSGTSTDVLGTPRPAIASEFRLAVAGRGTSPRDLDAELTLTAGPTKIDAITIDGIEAKARAHHGAYTLERFAAHGLGFDVTATGELAADKALTARIEVTGNPAHAARVLAAAGVPVPRRVPPIGKLALVATAAGRLDGELAVRIEPTRLALVGGAVRIAGDATLQNEQLQVAHATIALDKLDLAGLARLAGRPANVAGSVSGHLALTKTPTTRDATYDLTIALRDQPLVIAARGTANLTSATAHVRVSRSTDRAELASVTAMLPLDARGFQPRGAWCVKLDVAKRSLAELAALLPGTQLPAGTVEVHANLAGSPARPTGTIELAASAKREDLAVVATLVPTPRGLDILTKGALSIAGDELARLDGTVAMPYRFVGTQPELAALRAGLSVDATIDIPERPVASLAPLHAKLAPLDGNVGGRIVVKGPAKNPAIDAHLAWRGYRTAAGKPGETTLVATGTPAKLHAVIDHDAVTIAADVDRSTTGRVAIHAQMRAAQVSLLDVLPAFAASKLVEPGTLDWNMDADVVLAHGQLDQLAVTGHLDVTGASVRIPNSKRRYHDIALSITGEPTGLRLDALRLHETDVEQRTLEAAGHLALDKAKPRRLDLTVTSKAWLVWGGDKLGKADAPRATASGDIGIAVDLTTPVLGVDATVHSLALLAPDRYERGHYYETESPLGDIIYVDDQTRVGKLPVPAPPPARQHRRPMDIRVHIPRAIHLEQAPLDLMAKGDLVVRVRDDGVKTRGTLTMVRGSTNLFGRLSTLTSGAVTFSDEHPEGWLALEFARELPNVAERELSTTAGTANITFSGSPSKPKVSLHGAANSSMFEVMAMYNAGRPIYVTRPGLPASETVQAPHDDQWLVLTFMASNLPQLLFLDRVAAWADPYGEHFERHGDRYGVITRLDAERYIVDQKGRVRAVARSIIPGRSLNELQVDRMLINNDRAALGVGPRIGDRGGGGFGLSYEWSSRDGPVAPAAPPPRQLRRSKQSR